MQRDVWSDKGTTQRCGGRGQVTRTGPATPELSPLWADRPGIALGAALPVSLLMHQGLISPNNKARKEGHGPILPGRRLPPREVR